MRLALALMALFLAAPALAQTSNPSFTLRNRSNQAINEIFATPAGVDRWGRDRLGQSLISPGQAFPVRLPADGNCVYDIRVVYADGKPEERRRVNTCEIESLAFPGGQPSAAPASTGRADSGRADSGRADSGRQQEATDDPSFRLVNRGRADVNEIYVSRTGEDSWGRDRLGDDTLPGGGTRVIRLPNGPCTYDVRIVFANGETTEKRQLNLCVITDLRVP